MSGDQPAADDDADPRELRARLELVQEENQRLRAAYSRVRQVRHRRTALGLVAVGLVALAGAGLFPGQRVVLLVLAATGLFAGLLTWYLTPERFVAAAVGERIYAALASNASAAVDELGLSDRRLYVPLTDRSDREAALYVPQAATEEGLHPDGLTRLFVVPSDPEQRGLALRPTGELLLTALREAAPGGLAGQPFALVDQLADGLREQFELVDGVQPEVDATDNRATLAVSGSAYGDVTRFDHPVASLIGTGLAVGLDTPVQLEVDQTPDGQGDYLVTARWRPTQASTPPTSAADRSRTQPADTTAE